MNPVVLAVIGLGIGMIAFGGGGGESKTSQPTRPSGPRNGKPLEPNGGGVVGDGGGTPSGEGSGTYSARRLQRAVNLYAEARGFYEWRPLAVDGIIGRNTLAAISTVLWSIEDFYPSAPQPPPGVVISGGDFDVTRVTDASSLATYIERYANTRPEGTPSTVDPMDSLRTMFSEGLAAERAGNVTAAAEVYRDIIHFAPEGSDLWRQASSRLAALRMRHGSGV